MNLLQLRQKFRTLSGRYDLVSSTGADSGADYFIQSGQEWLDRRYNTKKSTGRVFRSVAAGEVVATFQYARAIKEVWAATAGDGRWQLEKKAIEDLRYEYPNIPSELDQGSPLYYTPAVLRTVPDQDRLAIEDLDAIIGYADVMVGSHYGYNGVIFLPPPSETTMIEVWGLFYSMPLNDDEDENFWSTAHSDILLMAAMRQIEVFNRNTQGRQDWESAITQMLEDIDKDVVDEELPEDSQMEG